MSDVVIRAEHLSKYYNLGVINNGTLFRDIQTWWALKHGKDDPHSQIGSHKYDTTKDGFWALKDLCFDIHQGDRVGIIGKNGAGKSTLLKVLSRITAPTEGNVRIKGRISSLLEVGTGFHGELTGRENIYLNGAILGMKRREVTQKLDEIIAFSEIENHIDTPVKRYSSGMYVRLAFAVAAHLDSEILIADEVLAVGDAAFQKKALGKMNELSAGQGRTVLFVSHNMNQVKSLCNKGLILDHGQLVRQDDDISKSIGYYLGSEKTDDNSFSTTYWHNDNSFSNEYLVPQKLEIRDEKNKIVTGELDYTKKYTIVSSFEIKSKTMYPITFGLRAMIGTECLVSFGTKPKVYEIGRYTVHFDLQAGKILPGNYTLVMSSSVLDHEWILNPDNAEISIRFAVKNTSKLMNNFMGKLSKGE